MVIEERNLSVAWGKAFLEVFEANEVSPLMVVIKDLDGREPIEVPSVRDALDHTLERADKGSCYTVANTIFPNGMWNPEAGREELFKRYLGILPRLRKHKGNRNGLYFERLISFGHDGSYSDGVNQLEHVIQTWNTGNPRRSALQASVFDPRRDHTNQRQRGFPCLMQLAFDPQGNGGLTITGVYVTQYIVERAYGNFLGLVRLGSFMAHEMGLTLTRVNCVATRAVLGKVPKRNLKQLAASVRDALAPFPAEVHRG